MAEQLSRRRFLVVAASGASAVAGGVAAWRLGLFGGKPDTGHSTPSPIDFPTDREKAGTIVLTSDEFWAIFAKDGSPRAENLQADPATADKYIYVTGFSIDQRGVTDAGTTDSGYAIRDRKVIRVPRDRYVLSDRPLDYGEFVAFDYGNQLDSQAAYTANAQGLGISLAVMPEIGPRGVERNPDGSEKMELVIQFPPAV